VEKKLQFSVVEPAGSAIKGPVKRPLKSSHKSVQRRPRRRR